MPLTGPAAVFVPTWQEAAVIGITLHYMLSSWRHPELRVYVGCYTNDFATIDALHRAAGGDPRLRLVIHNRVGPTTKADCLNRLYRALAEDELRSGQSARMIVIHDAEDMVDPAALGLLDAAMDTSDLVQLPVLPVPQPHSPWVGSHYCEEFAEAHGKAMVVRDALRAGMPLAGVGCVIRRDALTALARSKPSGDPFAADCLTEDYELGLGISAQGGTARFLRYRHAGSQLVATRAFFPFPAGPGCPAGDALDTWNSVSGMGPAWLERSSGGDLDADARPPRPPDCVGAGASLYFAGGGYGGVGDESCRTWRAFGIVAGTTDHSGPELCQLCLARRLAVRFYREGIRLGRRASLRVPDSGSQCHRHSGWQAGFDSLPQIAGWPGASVGQDAS